MAVTPEHRAYQLYWVGEMDADAAALVIRGEFKGRLQYIDGEWVKRAAKAERDRLFEPREAN